MRLGLIGPRRTSANMFGWLVRVAHKEVGYARATVMVEGLTADGAFSIGTISLAEFVAPVPASRTVGRMVPVGSVETSLGQLVPVLPADNMVVNGGNSSYHDDIGCVTETRPCTSDSGERRWASIAAIEVSSPAPVLTAAVFARFSSWGEADFVDDVLFAMRFGFGAYLESGR